MCSLQLVYHMFSSGLLFSLFFLCVCVQSPQSPITGHAVKTRLNEYVTQNGAIRTIKVRHLLEFNQIFLPWIPKVLSLSFS